MKQKRSFKIGVAGTLLTVGLLTAAFTTRTANESVRVVDRPDTQTTNANYVSYRAPHRPWNFIKLRKQKHGLKVYLPVASPTVTSAPSTNGTVNVNCGHK